MLTASGFIDPALAREALWPLFKGLLITVELTFIVIAISLVGGVVVALARSARFWPLRAFIGAYVELFRSTPLLIQLIFLYYALPFAGIRFSAMMAGIIGLSLNYIAYLSEVYRGGIQSVPAGQTHAAAALGMRRATVMTRIVLPQAVRIVLPTLGNYFVSLFKDTSLVSVITIQELLFSGQLIAARTFNYSTIYTLVLVYYLIVSYPAILGVRYLERRIRAGYAGRRRGRSTPPMSSVEMAEGRAL